MELNDFLVKAKVNTYASRGEENERRLEDGTRELEYEKNEWRYKDRYFGYNPFIGEEIVWKDEKIVWGMNYYGKVLSKIVSAERIYGFLKKALIRVEKSMPFRGPKFFNEREFGYRNSNSGSIEECRGVEMVFYQGKRVYELEYRGGLIKNQQKR